MITFDFTSVATASVIGLVVSSVATTAPEHGWLVAASEAGGTESAPRLDAGWRETLYLLASPANAAVLNKQAVNRESDIIMSIDEVWAHFGVPKE